MSTRGTSAATRAPGRFPLAALARRLGLSNTAIHRGVRAGRVPDFAARDADGMWYITDLEAAAAQFKATRRSAINNQAGVEAPPGEPTAAARAAQTPDGEMTLNQASAVEKRWRAKLAELEYRKRAGELVDAREAETAYASAMSDLRTAVLALPTRARQRLPHLPAQDVRALEDLAREVLERLSGAAVGGA